MQCYINGRFFADISLKASSTNVAGQAQLAHHMTWLDPIDDREMVQQAVANWTAARMQANVQDQ